MLALKEMLALSALATCMPLASWATENPPGNVPAAAASTASAPGHADTAQQDRLKQAVSLIKAGQPEAAITGPIDQVISYFEKHYGNDRSQHYYAARSLVETLLYATSAAQRHATAVVLAPTWAQAYFLKGSALNGLGRYDDARVALQKALALSPWNSMYLTELAFGYEQQHQSTQALTLCDKAYAAAEFSPDALKTSEQGRALRCQGYNLTELRRYDEAVKQYRAALKLDSNDAISRNELDYIKQRRAQSGSSSP